LRNTVSSGGIAPLRVVLFPLCAPLLFDIGNNQWW
jgi:hypothetical protein